MRKYLASLALTGVLSMLVFGDGRVKSGGVFPEDFPIIRTATTPPSWVDPNKISGKFLCSHELYSDSSLIVAGQVTDPNNILYKDPIILELKGLPGSPVIEPNNAWHYRFDPNTSDIGKIYYGIFTATAIPPLDGKWKTDQGTVAVKIVQPHAPPVIKTGGCRTVER